MHFPAFATLLLALAPWSATNASPLAELGRMADAVRQLNYSGTFVYDHAGMLETMRIVHQADAEGEREHLVSLDGAPREMVRDGDGVVCLLGDAKALSFDRAGGTRAVFPGKPRGELERLDANYLFERGDAARVAGRDTHALLIRPRDGLRYGYRLWLDQATGLPLRSELVGSDGEALERILFTAVEVHDAADPDVAAAIRERKAAVATGVAAANSRPEPAARRWRVADLPPGFELTDYRSYTMQGENAVDHLVFSDGLATVSVYVEPVGSASPLSGTMRRGAVSTFATVHDTHQVVVVGDVPMATAHIIGVAVQPLAGVARP